jgi:hypothetical protein
VELNGAALQDLLGTAPVAVPAGTYNEVQVLICAPGETGYRSQVTGTASIGGATYYTRTTGTLATTGPAEPVAIDYNGCAFGSPISPPLVITDTLTATTVVRLYFDILDIASAVLPSPQTNRLWVVGTCSAVTLGAAPFLCMAYPNVIAVVGTTPPRIEHYRVNDGATIGLVFDATSDLYYGGYFRRYVIEDQPWSPGFAPDGDVGSLTRNSDGTYRLQQHAYTSGQPGALFPGWQRATHTGTFNNGGGSLAYSAVRLP